MNGTGIGDAYADRYDPTYDYAIGAFGTDTAAAADTATRGAASFHASCGDVAHGTDAAVKVENLHLAVGDTATASDAAARSPIWFSRPATDTAAGADTAQHTLGSHRAISDTATASDAAAVVRQQAATVADTAAASDAGSGYRGRVVAVADSAAAVDTVGTHTAAGRAAAETVRAVESLTVSGGDNQIGVADTAFGSDAAGRVALTNAEVDDTAHASDAAAAGYTRNARQLADTAHAADAAPLTASRSRAVVDAAAANDAAVSHAYRLSALPTDTAHASDAAAAVYGKAQATRSAADTAVASDRAVPLQALTDSGAGGGLRILVWDITHTELLAVVPEVLTVTVQDELDQDGSVQVALASCSPGVEVLANQPAAFVDVYEQQRLLGSLVYDEDDTDLADLAGPEAEVDISGPGPLSVLTWALVWPATEDGPTTRDFVNVTPGQLLTELLAEAQTRGTLAGPGSGPLVTMSFTESADSDGTPWPETVWVSYTTDKTLHDVVTDLCDRGLVHTRMRGTTWDVYVADGAPNLSTNVISAATSDGAAGWQTNAGYTTLFTDLPRSVPAVTAIADVDSPAAPTGADGVVHLADAVAETPRFAIVGGASYVPRVLVKGGLGPPNNKGKFPPATSRAVQVKVRWWASPGASSTIAESWLQSVNDLPKDWTPIDGAFDAPAGANYASIQVTIEQVPNGETHRIAYPILAGPVQSSMTADNPDVVLFRPDYTSSAPSRRQRSSIGTVLLGIGENNLSVAVEDDDAMALYGRREQAASQSGVADYATLRQLTKLTLGSASKPATGYSATYARDAVPDGINRPAPPQPWRDYRVGNKLRASWLRECDVLGGDPTDTSLLPLTVTTITATWDTSGVRTAEVEFGDIFLDADEKLQRQMQGILNGVGTDPVGATTDPTAVDVTPPSPVSELSAGSDAVEANGNWLAEVSINWPAVTTDTDGTPISDLGFYQLDYRVGEYAGDDLDSGWVGVQLTQDTTAGVTGLPIGATFQARMLVIDTQGRYATDDVGDPIYTYSAPITLATDQTPPGAPAPPTVTSLPGALQIDWSGLDTSGAAMPPDYDGVQFHVSSAPNPPDFSPTSQTLASTVVGQSVGANAIVTVPRLQYDVDYYVRLVTFDTAGNTATGPYTGPWRIRLIGPADFDPNALTDTDHSASFVGADFAGQGTLVADAAARGGTAWHVTGYGAASLIDEYAGLAAGRYRATFLVRSQAAAGAVPTATVAQLVASGTDVVNDGVVVLNGNLLPNAGGYEAVAATFTVLEDGASLDLTVENPTAGDLWVGGAYVEQMQSIAVLEVRDEQIVDLNATKITSGEMSAGLILAEDEDGNPGRVYVGIYDPATNADDLPGFEVSVAGLRAQASGGVQTFYVDPNSGLVQLTGSIIAGSTLPGSVYGANLIQNAAMEDLAIGAKPNTPGTVPATWVDGWSVAGSAGSAYADQIAPIGGTQSLEVQLNDRASGRMVASRSIAVVPGERLQISAQFQRQGVAAPLVLQVAFGNAQAFPSTQLVTAVPAVPDACAILNLDGTLADVSAGASSRAGVATIAYWTAPDTNVYKATGSVVVPKGATWMRVLVGVWTAGGSASGSTWAWFDATDAQRASDGHRLSNAVIVAPTIETDTSGRRVVLSGTSTGPSVQLFSGAANETFAGQLKVVDVTPYALGINGGADSVLLSAPVVSNLNAYSPALLMFTGSDGSRNVFFVPYGGSASSIGSATGIHVAIGVPPSTGSGNASFCVYGTAEVTSNLTVDGDIFCVLPSKTSQQPNVYMDSNGKFWMGLISGSSERFKYEIADLDPSEAKRVLDLRPRTHRWLDRKGDPDDVVCWGVIAEEAVDHTPRLVGVDAEGRPESFDYAKATVGLIAVGQDHEARLAAIERKLATLAP